MEGLGGGPTVGRCPRGHHRGNGGIGGKVDTKGLGKAQEVVGLKVIPGTFLSGYGNNAKSGVRHVVVVRVRGGGF